jgi:hypothetical protein
MLPILLLLYLLLFCIPLHICLDPPPHPSCLTWIFTSSNNLRYLPVTSLQWLRSLFFLLLFYHFYIYIHVYTLFVPPPLQYPASRQTLFCPLLRFSWRENIRDNKKDILFLLVCDKDSYTERCLALLPCTCMLQPTLVHFFQTSLLLLGPLPILASAKLRLL